MKNNSKLKTIKSNRKFRNFAAGQVMILSIVALVIILILGSSLFTKTALFINFSSRSIVNEQATQLAEAGLDYSIQRLNDLTGAYPNADGEGIVTLNLSTGEVIIQVTNKGQALRTIKSTGYIPNSANATTKRTVIADVGITTQQVAFSYAAQVGDGGVSMANSSRINGSIYTNGSIVGSGSSTITKDAWAVGTISQPDPWVQGNRHPEVSPTPLPTLSNPTVAELKTDAENGGTETCTPTCTINSDQPISKKKYVGNLMITNNSQVDMITGPIYVTGDFTISQGSTVLKLDNSFGSNGSYIIVDGKIIQSQGGQIQPTNANPKGYLIIITTSTADDAIQLSQSGTNAIFYALDGGGELSQSANVTTIVAKKLTLTQSATLTYDQGLAIANFIGGPGASWQIKKGTYRQTFSP
ncbi:hypothetical protein COT87_00350 [Candidatus Collierbacteria bacterium CG10_big_fil_rev_8_21_14_0_10_44_9]|uniref:Type 4 fimbrial biogenesis protein PilX N-terminal domain-containing protein n=1 Tax=Candidatus Collierbacteria bacterium CG10_big_fil_rev_8_21_14_0_10_44_9 TaxID=1974535 RepID=A0A2H0VJL1_9BACT|nr:MAG: hypothetical protein COT87_00350 [Candidatus Collierbacteria bacterium CG10_big_fil_rev_8_21_14_0_10_44_9]